MAETHNWRFRRMQAGEMNIDPIEAEFFSTDALGSLADAFVREAIQNSLDARQPNTTARVRITFPAPEQMLSGERKARYVAGLWPHLVADRSGLANLPSIDEPLGFLVFEDFGTRGLQGDPSQSEDEEIGASAPRNDFYYFWRNIGRSRKQSSELGRWGLGKTVFPASSRVNAFFALTVRNDDSLRLLMGQSVLRIHKLDGVRYYPYGYFGRFEGDFAMPVREDQLLDEFCEDFAISRSREAGLSVVIPFPDSDLTLRAVLPSIVRHYFVPILAGDLVVELAHEQKVELLDARRLPHLLARANWDKAPRLRQLAQLAQWALQVPEGELARLAEQPHSAAPKWTEDTMSPQVIELLRQRFNRGERIALSIPVWVKPAAGTETLGRFELYIERDESLSSGEEYFIREGITVAGVRSGVQAGVRALVYVRDRALSALLGDSENPAHTEWQERSLHFKERYRHGPWTLRFVKNAPREIVRMLTRPAAGRDFRLLQHIFARELPTEEAVRQHARARNSGPGDGEGEQPGTGDIVGSDRFFALQKLQDGFSVTGTGAATAPPALAIQMAYEVRRGNPFSLYHPLDFEIGAPPFQVHAQGAQVMRLLRNLAVLHIDEPDFRVMVRGFDSRRDLRVKVLPLGEQASE